MSQEIPLSNALHPSRSRSAELRQTAGVLALAFTLRALVVLAVLMRYPRGWFFQRGIEMGLLADSLVHGEGLSSPFGGSTGPTAFIAPGYPLLVAGVFRLFGSYTPASAAAIITFQSLLNLLTIWLILYVARELSGLRAAWISGLFWACSLPLIWMPTIFWDTCFSACAVLGFVAMALRWRGRVSGRFALITGAACGIAGLINPALLPVLFCVVAWLALQSNAKTRLRLKHLLLSTVTFAVVFSPWPLRNARVFHTFIPLRTTVGFEVWMGNRPGSTGYLDESVFPMYNKRELSTYIVQGEVAYTDGKSRLAKQYIALHPSTFLRLTSWRILRFWMGTGNQGGSPLFALHACLTTVFGLCGLWGVFRRGLGRVGWLFVAMLLVFPLPYYITHAEFRYRLVIDPLLTVLSGCAIAWWSGERGRVETAASEGEVALAYLRS